MQFTKLIDPQPGIQSSNNVKLLPSLIHKDLFKLNQIKDNIECSQEIKELIKNEVEEIQRYQKEEFSFINIPIDD
jgi:hypothetical protein